MTDPHNTALEYAHKGWRVIPILPGTKRPALNQWQDAATTSTAQINQWWKGSQSSCGVGIATGKQSGIWVLDIDDRDALYELEREHGELPATLTSITGSGGEHQIYKWPADGRTIHNSASGFAPGIDVRGEGGQIVAPPTIHPNGNPYLNGCWISSATKTPNPHQRNPPRASLPLIVQETYGPTKQTGPKSSYQTAGNSHTPTTTANATGSDPAKN